MSIGDYTNPTWENGEVINATKLQTMTDKIEELDTNALIRNDAVMITKTTAQTITNTNETKVTFDTEAIRVGDKLILDDNGIYVDSNYLNTIEVACTLWVERTTYSYARLYIKKNFTTVYAQHIIPARLSGQELWCSMSLSCLVDVVIQDYINAYIVFSTGHASENKVNGGYDNSCILMAKAIELK